MNRPKRKRTAKVDPYFEIEHLPSIKQEIEDNENQQNAESQRLDKLAAFMDDSEDEYKPDPRDLLLVRKSAKFDSTVEQDDEANRTCVFCKHLCASKEELSLHMKATHEQDLARTQVFVCRYCEVKSTFNSEEERLDHVNNNHSEKFACINCPEDEKYVAKTEKDWENHLHAAHKHGKLDCHLCGKSFNNFRPFNLHLNTTHGKAEYLCVRPQCDGRSFVTASVRNEHIRAVHLNLKKFECGVCHKKFSRYALMDSHVKSKHLGMEQVWCGQCGYRPRNAHAYKLHMENKHGQVSEVLSCGKCNYQTISKISLMRHKGQAHVPCYHCDEFFDTVEELDQHFLFLHPDSLMCTVCHNRFASSQELNDHLAKHFEDSLFGCEQCSFETDTIAGLNEHILKEHLLTESQASEIVKVYDPATQEFNDVTGNIYRCFECDYWSQDMRALVKHVKIEHFEIKDDLPPCVRCGDKLKKLVEKYGDPKKAMEEHLKKCQKQPDVSCEKCDFTTVHYQKLKRHYKSMHNIKLKTHNKNMKCPHIQCNYVADRAVYMNRHIKTKHGGDDKGALTLDESLPDQDEVEEAKENIEA